MENLSYHRGKVGKRVGKQQRRRRFYPVSLLICDCLAPPPGYRHTCLLNAALLNLKEERFQRSFITAFEITAANTGGGPEAAPPVELPPLVSVPLSSCGPRTPTPRSYCTVSPLGCAVAGRCVSILLSPDRSLSPHLPTSLVISLLRAI